MKNYKKFANFLIEISILLQFVVSQQVSDENQPFLRVLAPKFICPDEKVSQSQQNVSSRVTIGLQTSEGQKLKYSIAIDFEILDGFQSQRHTLSIWKNVRELQAKLATQSVSDEISLKNQLEIDAKELTPQVIYTFRITGHDQKNVPSLTQNFTITYKGDELQTTQSNISDGVSLFLYGSESFRNDAEFLAVAEVSFCDPITDYFYQWKIDGMNADEDYLDVRGSVLKIPPGVLEEGKFYEVRVTILNKQKEAMASVSLPVKIFAVPFEVQNIPSACTVGISKEVPFSALIYRRFDIQNLNIKWTCSDDCESFFVNSSESIQTTLSFTKEGNFVLKSTATLNEVNKESTTSVTVNPKVIPHAVMKYFPPQPINAHEGHEFVATIVDLVPKCTATWSLVIEEGFAEAISGNVADLGSISIRDYEEHFLNELVDYDNSTLSKDITMTIPADTLKADEKYKFRLSINCPEPINDMNATNRKNVMTFYDIIVETNGPPSPLELEIFPPEGIPMKQEFKFSTGAAKDRQSDYPLKYTFGYKVNDLQIIIGSFFENQVAHTQLPFSNSIETFMEICDNNNACFIKAGPTVTATQIHKYSEAEINFKLDEIRGSLSRSEYSKVLNSAVILILTVKQINDNPKEYEDKIVELLKNELNQLKSEKSTKFVYQQRVIEFVKMSENLMRIIAINDDEFIENVLSLTDGRSRLRQKRFSLLSVNQKAIVSRNTDYMKNILTLSDVLLSSSNNDVVKREKKRFVTKIHQFVASLCGDKNLNAKLIRSKYVAFEVSKIYSRHLYNEAQNFPPDEKSTIVFTHNSNFPTKFICIGNIKYKTDVYDLDNDAKDEVYETVVMDNFGTENPSLIQGSTIGDQAILEFVGDEKNITDENVCQTWTTNQWNICEKQIIEKKKIVCKCKTSRDSVVVKYGKYREKSNKNHSEVDKNPGSDESKDENGGDKNNNENSGKGTETNQGSNNQVNDKSNKGENNSSGETTKSGNSPHNESAGDSTESSGKGNKNEENSNKGNGGSNNENNQGQNGNSDDLLNSDDKAKVTLKPDENESKNPSQSNSATPKPVESNSEIGTKSSSEVTTKSSLELTTKISSDSNSDSENSPTNDPIDSNKNENKITTESSNPNNENGDKVTPPASQENNKDSNEDSLNSATKNSTEISNGNNSSEENSSGNSSNEIKNSNENKITTKSPNNSVNNVNPTQNPSENSSKGHSESLTENPKKGENIVQKSTAPIKTVTPGTTSKPSNTALKGTTKILSSTLAATTESLAEIITTIATSTEQTAESNEASVSWTLIICLIVLFVAIIIIFLLYKCRSYAQSNINLPMRHPSKEIKYAKYHDEFIMRG